MGVEAHFSFLEIEHLRIITLGHVGIAVPRSHGIQTETMLCSLRCKGFDHAGKVGFEEL